MEKLKESCFIYVNFKYALWESDVYSIYITLGAKSLFHFGKTEFTGETVEFVQRFFNAYLDIEEGDNISLELVVNVVNISTKAGGKLLKKCKNFGKCFWFMEKVEKYKN